MIPAQPYPNTCPSWMRSILPLETPFERADRIEKAFKEVEKARENAKALYEDRIEHLDNYELFLHDQLLQVNKELEAMGEET